MAYTLIVTMEILVFDVGGGYTVQCYKNIYNEDALAILIKKCIFKVIWEWYILHVKLYVDIFYEYLRAQNMDNGWTRPFPTTNIQRTEGYGKSTRYHALYTYID